MHWRLCWDNRRAPARHSKGAHAGGARRRAGMRTLHPAPGQRHCRLSRHRTTAARDSWYQRYSIRRIRQHAPRPARPRLAEDTRRGRCRRRAATELRLLAGRAHQDEAATLAARRRHAEPNLGRRPAHISIGRLPGALPRPRHNDGSRFALICHLFRLVRGDDARGPVGSACVCRWRSSRNAVMGAAVPAGRGEVAAAGGRRGPVRGRVGLRRAVGARRGLGVHGPRPGGGHPARVCLQRCVLHGGGVDGARVAELHTGGGGGGGGARHRRPSRRPVPAITIPPMCLMSKSPLFFK